MSFLDNYRPASDRFVVFRARPGCGGLGDRVVGLLSSCVLALVAQCQFRIAWAHPIRLRAAWRPTNRQLAWDRDDWGEPGAYPLSLIDQAQSLHGFFRRQDFTQWLHRNLLIEANQHFFSDVLANASLQRSVDGYRFPDAVTLSGELLDHLFGPTDELAQALAPFRARMAGRRWLGIQIRTLWNWLDGGGPLDDADVDRFCDCAKELLADGRADAVFATADDPAALEFVRRRLPVEVLTVGGPIMHLDRSQDGQPADHLATFVNLHLLRDCDEQIISHWSNFGRLAALWAGRAPCVTRKSHGTAPLELAGDYRFARLEELISKEPYAEPVALGGKS